MNTLSAPNLTAAVVQTAGTLPERSTAAVSPTVALPQAGNAASMGSDTERSVPPPREVVEMAAKQIESFVKSNNLNLSFSVDDSLNRPIVKVVDPDTKDVIRQIPAEETLQIAKSLEFLNSVLVRQKA